MSFDKSEHLRRTVEDVWNHGDVEGFMVAFADDAELQPEATYPDGGPTVTGKAAITRFFHKIHRPVELGALEEIGDQVMCSFRWSGSAPETRYDWAFLYRFDGDRIVRARYYRDVEHARSAAADPST
jgi:hypothetical protein